MKHSFSKKLIDVIRSYIVTPSILCLDDMISFSCEILLSEEKLKKGFQTHDTKTHVHGGHIFTGEVGWSKKVLGERNLARMEKLLTCDIGDILDIDLGE